MERDSPMSPETQKPAVLYHASSHRDIEIFEPRAEKVRDPREGPVVFATPDRAASTCFIVNTDDSWTQISRFSDETGVGERYFICGDRDRFLKADRGGAIYTLPSDTFEHDQIINPKTNEWTSRVSVTPTTKDDVESGLEAMIEAGIKVYFVDTPTFQAIKSADDHGKSILDGLKSENQLLQNRQ